MSFLVHAFLYNTNNEFPSHNNRQGMRPTYQVIGAEQRPRRWSNKANVVGSIPVTTDFFLISCDSKQLLKWFRTHYNLDVPL